MYIPNLTKIFIIFIIIFVKLMPTTGDLQSSTTSSRNVSSSANFTLTAELYSKLLLTRRKEHTLVVKYMVKNSYEKTFKMMDFAYEKIFEVIKLNNQTLNESGYDFQNLRFPTSNQRQQEAFTLIIENTCLFATIFLRLPEISYRVLKNSKYSHWKNVLSWSSEFVSSFPHIVDEPTAKLIELVQQQLQYDNFKTPNKLSNGNNSTLKFQSSKKRKKLKKGPQLISGQSKTEL